MEGTKAAAIDAQVDRQRAWLKRKHSSVDGPKAWRIKKRHRRGAYLWLVALHNQCRAFIKNGLLHFRKDDETWTADPASWPRMSMSPDMGSAGVCEQIRGAAYFVVSVVCPASHTHDT